LSFNFAENRTPGLSSGVPTNSIPAVSNAFIKENSVLTFPDGTPSINSNRLMVATPTPDLLDKSLEDHFSKARAALI